MIAVAECSIAKEQRGAADDRQQGQPSPMLTRANRH